MGVQPVYNQPVAPINPLCDQHDQIVKKQWHATVLTSLMSYSHYAIVNAVRGMRKEINLRSDQNRRKAAIAISHTSSIAFQCACIRI